MIKKLLCGCITIFMLCQIICINTFAADLKIRQVQGDLPDVKIEISGKHSSDDIKTILLEDEELSVSELLNSDDDKNELVYILVDISGSMSQSHLNALKPSLIDFILSLDKKDKFVVKTFGTEVTTVLDGDESEDEIRSVINNLWCNSDSTTFYSAISETLHDSLGLKKYDREYAIVISDGADFEKGNSSQQEVADELETHRLPFYALCQSTAVKSDADGFGYISRISGGELVTFSAYDAAEKFQDVLDIVNDVTILKTKSDKNKSIKVADLKLTVNKTKLVQSVCVSAKKDSVKPYVEEITFDKENNCFVVTFSENVDNAEKISSYFITKNDKEIIINDVTYEDCVAKISVGKKIYTGEYTFEFYDIFDSSDERNKLDEDLMTEEIKANSILVLVLTILLIVLIPVAFLVAIYLILLKLKKKKNVNKIKEVFVTQINETEVEKVHIQEPQGKRILVHVDCRNGQEHRIEYNLIGSMIVGRDSISDICIDDASMSKQHFAIEIVENGLAITDLQTTNGTFVNGVEIKSRTFLNNNAKIFAGNSIITINY